MSETLLFNQPPLPIAERCVRVYSTPQTLVWAVWEGEQDMLTQKLEEPREEPIHLILMGIPPLSLWSAAGWTQLSMLVYLRVSGFLFTRTTSPAHLLPYSLSYTDTAKEDLEQILASGMDEQNIARALIGLGMRGVYGSAIDVFADLGVDMVSNVDGHALPDRYVLATAWCC
jgi:hypothetical protein